MRLGELGTVYRYERSGVMHGLLRVRGFTQDDAHIFCTPEQIENEIVDCLEFAIDVLKDFGFDKYPDRAFDLGCGRPARVTTAATEQWSMATNSLESVLKRLNIEYKMMPGRSGVLRTEDRREAGGRDRPAVAAFDCAVRFHAAAALWIGVRRRGWVSASSR